VFLNKKIARAAKAQGTTRFLHFHQAKLGAEKILLVDAPGYGFAQINKSKREMWAGLTDEYLKISPRVAQIFLCINLEHGVKHNDIETLSHITKYNINIQLLLCKADKVP
jgi:GTP-binding protein